MNMYGKSALVIAIQQADVKMINLLSPLEKHLRTRQNRTMLMQSVLKNDIQISSQFVS